MKNKLIILASLLPAVIFLSQCNKDEEAQGTDKELLDMAVSTNGFTWYKNSDALLNKSAGSGHNYPFLRTRYNAIAATKLDSTGRIMAGAIFDDGSLIVKELTESNSSIGRYAILYKQAGHQDADANGWVCGYINADGTVAAPAFDKGSGCTGCHSQTGNIDYMLMNKYFL